MAKQDPRTDYHRELMARTRTADRALTRRQPADQKRRKRLERDPAKWLRFYMRSAFPIAFSAGHKAIIDGVIKAAKTGTGVAVAAPRGEGKTTVLRGMALYLTATRVCRFPVVAGWTHRSAAEAFRVWLRMLHNSPEFAADYPEMTQPFEESTSPIRLRTLHWKGENAECGADVRNTEKTLVLPDSLGAIAAGSVQGDVKGLSVTLANGEALRPDLLLIDDAQDPKLADNPRIVADVVDRIEKQWMCMAGPQSRITTMVACTVACKGDVSEAMLSRPGFYSVRVSRVTCWPDGWTNPDSGVRQLWDEWQSELLAGMAEDDGGLRGRKFYKTHKPKLTTGMAVSWAQRYDRKRHDPDALYSAMFDFYRVGESAFMTEYQNSPMATASHHYDLTPAMVAGRINGRNRAELDPAAITVQAFADINYSALHWSVVAFRPDFSGEIVAYGRTPGSGVLIERNASEVERRQRIAWGLTQWLAQLRDLGIVVHRIGVDAGFEPATVQSWILAQRNAAFWCSRGFASTKYRPRNALVHYDHAHLSESPVAGRFVAFDSDYWRESAQRSLLVEPGGPGAVTIYGSDPRMHRAYSEHLCGEQLAEKIQFADGSRVYRWNHRPGESWDWLDSFTGCFVGANVGGLTQGPSRPAPRRYVETRKPRVEITM